MNKDEIAWWLVLGASGMHNVSPKSKVGGL